MRETTGTGPPDNVIAFPGRIPPGHEPGPFRPEPFALPAPPDVVPLLTVRVELVDADPPVRRTLELVGDLTLDAVHAVLQEAMGWWDSHLHGFRPSGSSERFLTAFDLEEGDEETAEGEVRLDQVLREVGDVLHYEYDFGDGWEHALVVEAVHPLRDGTPRARLLDGRGACPPEDVGGILHYNDVAAALRGEPDAIALDRQFLDWLPDGFDPDAFDLVATQAAVAHALDGVDVPVDLPPALAELFSRADPSGRRALVPLVASARDGAPASDELVQAAVHPWSVLLDVVGEGLVLTQAGYLPPSAVSAVFDALGLADEWIGKGNREDLTPPVALVRSTARELGLVRVTKGRLVPTKKGTALRTDAARLLAHVAAALPPGSADAERHAGALALLVVAAGMTSDVEMAKLTTEILCACGWETSRGPLEWQDVVPLLQLTWDVLDRVRDPQSRRLLARTALGL